MELTFNRRYWKPLSLGRGGSHNAVSVNNYLVIPTVQHGGQAYNLTFSTFGFLVVDSSFNIVSNTRSNMRWETILGIATINNIVYFYTANAHFIKYTLYDYSFSYIDLGQATSVNFFSINGHSLDTDGEYLYLSNGNTVYKIRADDLVTVSTVTIADMNLGNLKVYDNLLYVNAENYILIFTLDLELILVLKCFNFSPSVYHFVSNRIIILARNDDEDSSGIDVFNISVTDLQKILDLKVKNYRIIRKNPKLFNIERNHTLQLHLVTNIALINANLLDDTPFTISTAQDSNNKIQYYRF